MNPLMLVMVFCGGGIVVCIKAFADTLKTEGENFKFDTVTDLRLRRKFFNDKHYKNNTTNRNSGGKGI